MYNVISQLRFPLKKLNFLFLKEINFYIKKIF